MERDNFPMGSSGGGGKRGYGGNPSFLNPRGDESPSSNSSQNHLNRHINNRNRRASNSGDNVADWIEGLERVRINRLEEDDSVTTSSDQEYRRDVRYDRGHNRGEDVEFGRQQGPLGFTAYVGYRGFIGFPHGPGAYGFAGYVGAPVLGQGGLALRLNGSNAIDYGSRAGASNGGFRGRMNGNHGINNIGLPPPGLHAGYGGMYFAGHDGGYNMNYYNNGGLFYYTSCTAYAHQRHNGEVLSNMFCLRNSHIFNIISSVNYAGIISQVCNNVDLAQAMINHLDCVKALLIRNIPLALTKQIACVNALMKLLNEPYSRHEEWTFPIIRTVTFDLKVISVKATSAGCRGRVIVRYDWAVNNLARLVHPPECRCHQRKVYHTRNFYRRY